MFLGNFVCRPLAAYYLYDGNNFLTVRSGYCAKAHRIIRQLVKGYVDLAAVFAYAEASRMFFISERLCGIAVRISRFGKAIGSSVREGSLSRNLKHRVCGNGGKQYIVKLFFEDYGYILPAVSYGECSFFRFTFRCGNLIGICAVFEQIAAVLFGNNGFFTGFHRQNRSCGREHELDRVLCIGVLPSQNGIVIFLVRISRSEERSHARRFQLGVGFFGNAHSSIVSTVAFKIFRCLIIAIFRFYKSGNFFSAGFFAYTRSNDAACGYISFRVIIYNISGVIAVRKNSARIRSTGNIAHYAADALCVGVAKGC